MNAKTYLIITRYQRLRTAGHRPYVTLACEDEYSVKKYKKTIVDDEEKDVKGEQMATSESWQLFVHNGRHNHKVVVYNHGHAQAARLMEEHAQNIYNVVANIKRNGMQRRNTIEKVLCLSTQRGYTVFHINCEESNVLSDIVVAHPTSIAIIRTWPYILIMDTTYKTNKYNMPLLEAVGMTPTEKNFTVATVFMCNEQAMTYTWVLQQIKHLYFTSAMSNDQEMVKNEEVAQRFVNGSWKKLINEIDELEYQRKLKVLKTRWKSRPKFLHYLFSTWLNPFAHKFCRVWTSQVLHFGVESMNRARSEYSVLKLWLSTCHGNLDTMFLNIDYLIQGQIVEIKYSLEISKLKEKYIAKSNAILKNLSNKISYLALKKIMDELKKAREMVEEPRSNCLHYLRKSHGLPCAYEPCLHKNIPQHVHPVIWRPACLLRLNRVGENTLPIPELSQNPVRHVRLDAVKICNKPVPRENPASPNLLHHIRYPPNLINCHHIQS
ncbi:hypothetical protein M9H77_03209 [Catharanthus roseus]|uniref:Uncharacterized protein n=1 Tax=Catharanthus roseus TaxID=4058 RepID=A0ACC0CAM9_CATRO|nr:hypothetical protein M9H77_03209 [Catharanthus roseus]